MKSQNFLAWCMLTIIAQYEFIAAPCPLEIAKEATRAYYEDGGYDRDLAAIVTTVQAQFSQPAEHDKQVVIFDVDDVALSAYPFFKAHDFGLAWTTWCSTVQEGKLPAVEQMKALYQYFQKLGYKIVFITSRSSKFHEATHNNLITVGYTNFERLITRGIDQEKMHGAHFKEQERTKLVQEGYEIVCCIDDLENNLKGAHVGYAVKIPNMLYS
jgi:predicted secreted acid phosphatase